jgi:hypothetical protein
LWRIATIAKEAGLKFLSRNYQLPVVAILVKGSEKNEHSL